MSNIPAPLIEEIITAYKTGESRAEIAARYGVHKNTIGDLLKRRGVQLRPKNGAPGATAGSAVSPELRQKVVAAYQAGATYEDLMAQFGLTIALVRSSLAAEGVKPRTRGVAIKATAWLNMLAERPQEVAEAYKAGTTIEALAARYGVSSATVHKHLHQSDTEARPRGPKRERRDDGTLCCCNCRQWKPKESFMPHPNGLAGRLSSCKDCERIKYRKRMYGVDEERFKELMAEQEGVCAICGAGPESQRNGKVKKFLSVDHCHTTGTVRGLLCQSCNKSLGLMADSPIMLRAAADYLERSAACSKEATGVV